MIEMPPIPSWEGLHPIIIHFPIGLLLVAPLFVALSVISKKWGRAFALSALILMALGTAAAFLAVETGEAAAKIADRSPEINKVLQHHQELADKVRIIFSVLTLLFASLLFVPKILKKELKPAVTVGITLVFLLLYMAGALVLANTAHNGGILVHGYGVHALVDVPQAPQTGS